MISFQQKSRSRFNFLLNFTYQIHNNNYSNMSNIKRQLESNEQEEQEKPESTAVKNVKRFKKIIDEHSSLELSDYYIENNLRKVYPYSYTHTSYCKGRWVGKKLNELMKTEFRAVDYTEFDERCQRGDLKINGETITSDYVLQNNDFITSHIHRHELPVLAVPVPIIHLDDDMIVIDKPPSIPVHPCGKYRLNTITSILEKENHMTDLHVIHRLDRLTSGVMLLARKKYKAQLLGKEMVNREMHKEYLCRVEGKFPDGIIECNKSVETLSHKMAICMVSDTGKESFTSFERINYNGKSSTVLCKPKTGRMHQIRVHLQYLGYPILNDSIYNCTCFGPNKGKNGETGKSREQLIKDLEIHHDRSKFLLSNCKPETSMTKEEEEQNIIALKAMEHYTSQQTWFEIKKKYEYDPTKWSNEEFCVDCKEFTCDPKPYEQFIYLHAIRYKGKDWCYESQIPIWAKDTWEH